MSPRKPTADVPSRATRLVTWWEGWPRMVALAAGGVAAILVGIYAAQGVRLLQTVKPRLVPDVGKELDPIPDFAKKPRNVLLLGSDSRAGLSEEEQAQFGTEETVEGERSDTIILMHIDPRRERAVVIHFPRDLRVEIPGYGFNKINAAYDLGGPPLVVKTVRTFTGLRIHNYMEIDLAGFEGLINTLGGVRVCVDRPMVDELAGLNIPSAGCHTLDGSEALAFARARHIPGDPNPIPDFSRIGRQQQLMRAVLNKVLSAPNLLNTGLITAAAQNISTDGSVSTAEFVYLGEKLKELAHEDPSGATTLDFRVVPSTPAPELIAGVSYVLPVQPDANQLFARLRQRKPLGSLGKVLVNTTRSPAQVNVAARDGGDPLETEEADAFLRRAGFIVHDPAPAPAGYDQSVILYRPGSRPNAEVVQAFFDQLPMEEAPVELFEGDLQVMVVVAPDFAELTAEP